MEGKLDRPNILVRIFTNKTNLSTICAIAIFAIIAWAYFLPDALSGNVLKQHDVLQGIAIGQEAKAYEAQTGETTRWTNSLFSGMPNFQISPSYQSSKPISWLTTIYSLGFPSPVNILFIMMVGFYILMLSFKVKWYLAVPGAIAYAFSTYFFILIGAGHIWKYVTLAYIPPTIAGVVWAYRGKYITGGIVAALFATFQITSNHVQMTYYFLFVIVALMIAFLVLAINKKEMKQWLIATCVLIGAAIVAVGANSPNLYNTYKYSKESMRGGHSELKQKTDPNATSNGLNKDYITMWSYGIDETLSLIVPNINGGATIKPEKGTNKMLPLSDVEEAKTLYSKGKIEPQVYQYLSQFPQYFGDQPMTNGPVYVGALIFALFLLGCFIVKGPIKWALLIVTILSIFLAWGHNFMGLTNLFIDYFPMYNKFRAVASILVIAEFTIPLLGILALQKLLTTPDAIRVFRSPFLISFGVSIFICLVLWGFPKMIVGDGFSAEEYSAYIATGNAQQIPQLFDAVENIRLGMVSADAVRSLIVLLFGAAIILNYFYKPVNALSGRNATCVLLTLLIIFDLFSVNKRYLNTDSFTSEGYSQSIKVTPRAVDTAILQDTAMNYRVLDIPHFGDATPSYFHKMIGGYHAAKLTRYQDIIDKYFQTSINPNVIDMLNAKYIIVNDSMPVQINPAALGNAWFVDNIRYVATPDEEINAIGDTTFTPRSMAVSDKKFESILGNKVSTKQLGDTIYETSYAPNKLTYHSNSKNGRLAVFSEVYFPWGWQATVDGKPVEIGRVNYILRAIQVPAGTHNITFKFDPQSVKTTETIAYVAIVILYIGLILLILKCGNLKREKKEKEEDILSE